MGRNFAGGLEWFCRDQGAILEGTMDLLWKYPRFKAWASNPLFAPFSLL